MRTLAARDLLRRKAQLVSTQLTADARKLIEHYDRWLEEYEKLRGGATPDTTTAFVFVGPEGFPFPREAERRFRERASDLEGRLGMTPCT
jgi:hypothetical protein